MLSRTVLFSSVFLLLLKFNRAQNDGSTLYSRRYEKLNIDAILASPRLVTNYVECLLNRKPCPPEGKALKRILPEALRTKCGRCWPSQKEGAIQVITKLYYDYPQHYDALRAKWDSTGEYHRRFMEYLKDQKFNSINSNDDVNERQSTAATSTSVSTNKPLQTTQRPTPRVDFTARPPPPLLLTRVDSQLDESATGQDTVTQVQLADEAPSDFISNRFGEDVQMFQDNSPMRAQSPRTPAPTLPPITTQPPVVFTKTYFRVENPILNIIDRLSRKFTNTAGLLLRMFKG